MRDGGRPSKPAVVVLSAAAGPIEDAVLAGIEEEGVPHTVVRVGRGAATDLAQLAAVRSPLDVGVGVDDLGGVCVHSEKLSEPLPELTSSAADRAAARALGHNAARIVVGLPLKVVP